MYKARVEAISGTKILAGGKWLQCIGNKNFRVGELAWTDGRCAYGNHYTPQQPLVITAAAPQDEGIPIMLQPKSSTAKFEYYTFKKSLKLEKDDDEATLLYSLMANNQRSGCCFYDTSELGKSAISDLKEYSQAVTIALNNANDYFAVNKHFKVWQELEDWSAGDLRSGGYKPYQIHWYPGCESGGFYEETFIDFDKVVIEKNEEVIAEIDVTPFAEETAQNCPNYWGECGGAGEIIWSFIKDEKNWSLLLLCEYEKFIDFDEVNRLTQEDIDAYLAAHPEFDIDPVGFVEVPFPIPCSYDESRILTRLYYIDSQGAKKLVAEHLHKRPAVDVPYESDGFTEASDTGEPVYSYEQWEEYLQMISTYSGEWTSHNMTGIKFPLGGGYYYTSEEYKALLWSHARYTAEKRKIFSPSGEVIFDGWFDYDARINFCRVGANKFLLTVNKSHCFLYKDRYAEALGDTPFPQAGIHLLKKNDSTVDWELLQAGDVVLNQCLQPMTRYKKWHNRSSVVSAMFSLNS